MAEATTTKGRSGLYLFLVLLAIIASGVLTLSYVGSDDTTDVPQSDLTDLPTGPGSPTGN